MFIILNIIKLINWLDSLIGKNYKKIKGAFRIIYGLWYGKKKIKKWSNNCS